MPRYTRGAPGSRVAAENLQPNSTIVDPAQAFDNDTLIVVDHVSRPDLDKMVTLTGRRGSGVPCEFRIARDWPIELSRGEDKGFTRRVAPDHLSRLDRGDANELIDYALHKSQPEPLPAKARLKGWAAYGAALALAVLVLMMFHRAQPLTIVLLAALSGWLSDRGRLQIMGSRHGRDNAAIMEIIDRYLGGER